MLSWSSSNVSYKSFEHPVVVNNTPVAQTDTHNCLWVQIGWEAYLGQPFKFKHGLRRTSLSRDSLLIKPGLT